MPRLLLTLLLLTLAACTRPDSLTPPTLAPYQPAEAAVYPVLLLSKSLWNPVLCLCKTPAELRAQNDKHLQYLQKDGQLIDSAGGVFTLRNVVPAKGPKSGFRQFLVATILPNDATEIAFSLQPALTSSNSETWDALSYYHDHFRACGINKNLPAVELLRALRNSKCVYPPL